MKKLRKYHYLSLILNKELIKNTSDQNERRCKSNNNQNISD